MTSPAPPSWRPPATPRTSPPSTTWSATEAKRLGRLGDTDDYETRKAKALGIIAGRQGALELTDETRRPHGPAAGADEALRAHLPGRPRHTRRRRPGRRVRSRSSAPPPSTSSGPGCTTQGQHPPGPRPQPDRRRRPARPTTVDARAGHPPRPALRVPLVRPRRPASDLDHIEPTCRPTRAATRPDQPTKSRAAVPATSPSQDLRRLDLRTRPRRHLHLDQPPRPHLDRRTRRHQADHRARPPRRTQPRRTPSPPDGSPTSARHAVDAERRNMRAAPATASACSRPTAGARRAAAYAPAGARPGPAHHGDPD